jgi:hypothetical protein
MASEVGGRGTDEAGPSVVAATGHPTGDAGEGRSAGDAVSGNSDRGGVRQGHRTVGTGDDRRVEDGVVRRATGRR